EPPADWRPRSTETAGITADEIELRLNRFVLVKGEGSPRWQLNTGEVEIPLMWRHLTAERLGGFPVAAPVRPRGRPRQPARPAGTGGRLRGAGGQQFPGGPVGPGARPAAARRARR